MDISAIGRQFGLDQQQTEAAIQALGPMIAAGMRRSAGSGGGLADVLAGLQGASPAGPLELDQATSGGNEILGQIFGSKDVSRGVAQQAAETSGISSAILKKMLPVIASIVMAQLAKSMAGSGETSGGGLGDVLGGLLGGGGPGQSQGGLGDLLGGLLGGGAEPRQAQTGGLGDLLGGGGAGDDLLNSIEQAIRRRQAGQPP